MYGDDEDEGEREGKMSQPFQYSTGNNHVAVACDECLGIMKEDGSLLHVEGFRILPGGYGALPLGTPMLGIHRGSRDSILALAARSGWTINERADVVLCFECSQPVARGAD